MHIIVIASILAVGATAAPFLADVTTGLEPFFLGYGVLGVMFFLVMLGWLVPKWAYDYLKTQVMAKDEIIADLTESLRRLADIAEANRHPSRPPATSTPRGRKT